MSPRVHIIADRWNARTFSLFSCGADYGWIDETLKHLFHAMMECRCVGIMKAKLCSFSTSALDVSGWLHTCPPLLLEKRPSDTHWMASSAILDVSVMGKNPRTSARKKLQPYKNCSDNWAMKAIFKFCISVIVLDLNLNYSI